MPHTRPDPDRLLARIAAEDAGRARGRLKVFLGAAAGVGKTYAMLEAARARAQAGVDVVVGWAQPHGRRETEDLLEGLERVPPRAIAYHGVALSEFDIDAVLARRPQLVVVDELAHTNAPGSRHPKRWQDVEELLDAGIDVYTTVNIQHIESLNDIVAQITGVVVRETVPDRVLEHADEVELIDLPPADLLQRLREGKVYVPAQAAAAAEKFFRKGNLIALRELALRRTAERVDAQMRDYRRDHEIDQPWLATERILVCISASPMAPRLVRAGRRLAARLQAEWVVLFVERAGYAPRPAADRDRVTHTLRLAEGLGAETVTLAGDEVSTQILDYARARNVSKIVLGKPERPRWRELLFGSIVDEVVRGSGAIDVYVMTGEAGEDPPIARRILTPSSRWQGYARAVAMVGLATMVAGWMFPFLVETNLVMVFLLGIVWVARREGRGPSTLAVILSVAVFDFFFVPPYHTFSVDDTEYLVMFAVMLVVGLAISTLASRLRRQADTARDRERRTAALYGLSRDLAQLRGLDNLLDASARHIHDVFGSAVAVLLPHEGRLAARAMRPDAFELPPEEAAVAAWVLDHGRPAGRGTDTLPGADALYLPLSVGQQVLGVLAVRPAAPADPAELRTPEQLHLLEAFASQTALSVARAHLADEAQQARVQAEAERLRGTLLGSISHDLRTPLAAIAGSAETLLGDRGGLDDGTRRDLLEAVHEQAQHLSRLVTNLLDMTRLESGGIPLQREWQSPEEMIGAALARLEALLGRRPVVVDVPADLPEVACDAVLIEQVVFNLIENAVKHTPPDTPIEVFARAEPGAVAIAVADRGPGLPPGDAGRVFEKFYRGAAGRRTAGAGLGLAICRAIVEAHGGEIAAENREGGGAVFRFSLPDIRAVVAPSDTPDDDPPAMG